MYFLTPPKWAPGHNCTPRTATTKHTLQPVLLATRECFFQAKNQGEGEKALWAPEKDSAGAREPTETRLVTPVIRRLFAHCCVTFLVRS